MILLVEHQASCASLSWTRQANPGFASRPRVWTNSHRYSTSFRLVPPQRSDRTEIPHGSTAFQPGAEGEIGNDPTENRFKNRYPRAQGVTRQSRSLVPS